MNQTICGLALRETSTEPIGELGLALRLTTIVHIRP